MIAKGFWRFDLIAKGKTAHDARPWEGDSASVKLIRALHEITEYFKDQNLKTNSVNIGKINGGIQYNIVPDAMTASVEIRYLDKKNLNTLQKMVEDLCRKYDLDFELNGVFSAVQTDLKHPMVKPYLDSVEAITGRRPEGFISCAGSDAPAFYDSGVTCIISCCQGGGHHTDKEWIGRQSFNQFVPILRDYLDKTAKLL